MRPVSSGQRNAPSTDEMTARQLQPISPCTEAGVFRYKPSSQGLLPEAAQYSPSYRLAFVKVGRRTSLAG
jgi:hypothetical protein